jgi:capsular polysaccharide biosynthesis protein
MDSTRKEFDSTNIFEFFIRWWMHLAIVCILAAIAGAIYSSPVFITPMYESKTTMFPTTTTSLSRTVILAWRDFNEFGDVEEAERLLQILESETVRERVSERFNLLDHYEIPEDAKYKNTMLRGEYRSNFKFRRTQYGAVEVRVRDKDPVMAADMANYVTALVDTVMNEIRRERFVLAYEAAHSEYSNMMAQSHEYLDSLQKIMKTGVLDFGYQTQMLTRQLAVALAESNKAGSDMIDDRLQVMGEYGGSNIFQTAYLRLIAGDMMVLQRRYQEAELDLQTFVPFKFDIDRAFVAEKKVYPVRWLIVFLSTFGAGFMGVMLLIFYENLMARGIIHNRIKGLK